MESESLLLNKDSEAQKAFNENNMRKAYNTFLTNYPLCYGYWKKLADFELETTGAEAAISVYLFLYFFFLFSFDFLFLFNFLVNP